MPEKQPPPHFLYPISPDNPNQKACFHPESQRYTFTDELYIPMRSIRARIFLDNAHFSNNMAESAYCQSYLVLLITLRRIKQHWHLDGHPPNLRKQNRNNRNQINIATSEESGSTPITEVKLNCLLRLQTGNKSEAPGCSNAVVLLWLLQFPSIEATTHLFSFNSS